MLFENGIKSVYLCDPINGCTDDEATTWREKAKGLLQSKDPSAMNNYMCVDPMRRDYRGREGDFTA